MTNLNKVNEGFNKFCGPAVLSILTGKSTDVCASVISQVNGQYRISGVVVGDMLKALNRLGFDQKLVASDGSLYRTLTGLVYQDGIYMVLVKGHYVCIEVNDKQIYFCDNHTKEPIPAASSARLMMPVIAVYQVIKRAETVIEKPKIVEESQERLQTPQLLLSVIDQARFIHNCLANDSVVALRDELEHLNELTAKLVRINK